MRVLIPLAFLILLCFGCKKKNTSTTQIETTINQLDSLSVEKTDKKLLSLSTEATEDLASFEDFQNLKNIILTMSKSNPFYVQKYADSVSLIIQTVKENLTSDLKINPITSRFVVLSTESGLLKEIANKKQPNSKKLMGANARLIIAYNSLVTQLNEFSLAIPENIEKELLRNNKTHKDSSTNTN